jgi:nucleoside phosphorylase
VRDADAIVSAGICGALDRKLRIGDVVVATAVNGVELEQPETKRPFFAGPVASVDDVAGTGAAKQALRATGAIAVEMEAAGVLEAAQRLGRPCYCVKAVSDTADEEFLIDLNAARDASGRFSSWRILGQAAQRPLVAAPELLRLFRHSRAAAKALGEFIGDCSF